MGNIITLLYIGARVYLSEKNPAYHYFKRIGVIIFDFETEFKLYSNSILEEKYQNTNRNVLDKIFSKDILHLQYLELVNCLVNVD